MPWMSLVPILAPKKIPTQHDALSVFNMLLLCSCCCFWFWFMLTFLSICNFLTISYDLWCCLVVFLLLIKLRLSPNQNIPPIWIFTKNVQIWTFDRLTSHLGMSFQDNGLATLLLNNHSGLKTHKTLEMLNLFGLKTMFSMKIKFNFK